MNSVTEKIEPEDVTGSPCEPGQEFEGREGVDYIRLDKYGDDALLSREAVAQIMGAHPESVSRSTRELRWPQGIKLFGRVYWRVGTLKEYLARLAEAATKDTEKEAHRLRVSP